MKEDCMHYSYCRKSLQECSDECEFYNKSCMDCENCNGEECLMFGNECFGDSIPCNFFSEKERNI